MTTLTINGREVAVDAPPDMPLLWALRETLGLTGTKYGCGIAACGACTVHVDGVATRSCQLTVEAAAGSAITTIEGISGKPAAGGADGLAAARRRPVRLLPVGPDHGGDGAPGREPQAQRRRHQRRRCPATSVAAPPTSASAPRCTPPPS